MTTTIATVNPITHFGEGAYAANIKQADQYVRAAARRDAQLVCLPETYPGQWRSPITDTPIRELKGMARYHGVLGAAAPHKWLEMHGDTHFSPFYTDRGIALQKQFFGHFLMGEDNGWTRRPPVELQVRHPGEKFVARAEQEWPLSRTRWTKYYLDPVHLGLGTEPGSGPDLGYHAMRESLTFSTPPLTDDLEITGPVAAKLTLSSDTTDADVFLALRVFAPENEEVLFIGSNDPQVPVGLGWLRASHRKLDPNRSLPYRPLHTHDELWPLEPGSPVELDIEIWPTCIVVPQGHRVSLTISGRDYEHAPVELPGAMYPMTGVGPFLHNHPRDRPTEIFDGTNTLHFAHGEAPYLLLPIIPA